MKTDNFRIELNSEVDFSFQKIPEGRFRMGFRGGISDDDPATEVVIPESFFLGTFPVIQEQFEAWTTTVSGEGNYSDWLEINREKLEPNDSGNHQNYFKNKPRNPADNVSWWEACGFCSWLNKTTSMPEGFYARLPMEAEWEYACRAGTISEYHNGDGEAALADVGWYRANSNEMSHPAGEKSPNDFGLYDMHGNVTEWCLDRYEEKAARWRAPGLPADALPNVSSWDSRKTNPFLDKSILIFRRILDEQKPERHLDETACELLKAWNGFLQRQIRTDVEEFGRFRSAIETCTSQRVWLEEWDDLARIFLADATKQAEDGSIQALRVQRGGWWGESVSKRIKSACQSSFRAGYKPCFRMKSHGFRVGLFRAYSSAAPHNSQTEEFFNQGLIHLSERAMRANRDAGAQNLEPEQNLAFSISSENGEKWSHNERKFPVRKVVLGKPLWSQGRGESCKLTDRVLEAIASHWETITHLYFWGIQNVGELIELAGGEWPEMLRVLDMRDCPFVGAPSFPSTLEELAIWNCEGLKLEAKRQDDGFSRLIDLSIREISMVDENWINRVLSEAPLTSLFELYRCSSLRRIGNSWPEEMVDIRLNGNENLCDLPKEWPRRLRRLELSESCISELPTLPDSVEFLNLTKMNNLIDVPQFGRGMRTLFMHGSALALPDEMFGDEYFNSANRVRAHLDEVERVPDNEIKVILLGDGRAGKSSLARRLVDEEFDEHEQSTHGIRLWKTDLEFSPVEGGVSQVRLNIWDFAGQDLYHNSHRLFFQSKAVFLICGNCCPDGGSKETDEIEKENGADLRRTLAYWYDQVASLGSVTGLESETPVLVLRTKSDRDRESDEFQNRFNEENRKVLEETGCLDVSAKLPEIGIKELKKWLAGAAATVLGPLGKREIGKAPLAVKRELEVLMDANDLVHKRNDAALVKQEGESEPNSMHLELEPSPHPKMTTERFYEFTREHCRESAYAEDPSLLLSRFHLNGFLYYDSEYMPDDVVIDQRWAINGVYAAFDRDRMWPVLKALKGKFRQSMLAATAWAPLGFSKEDQRLFMRFMESCGLIFSLDDGRDTDGEFILPTALSEWRDLNVQVRANDQVYGEEPTETVRVSHRFLSRDAMMKLLVALGKEWHRGTGIWRWGGQFESYKNWERKFIKRGDERTFVRLNWDENEKGSFGGELVFSLYGPDRSFLQAVIHKASEIKDFKNVGFPKIDTHPHGEPSLENESIDLSKRTEDHAPDSLARERITIGVSFKGDAPSGTPIDQLEPESIELWPRTLSRALEERGFEVEQYRIEQIRDECEKSQDRKEYLDSLVAKDFVIAFLSWPYLESVWCMYEFLRIYERMNDGALDPSIARIVSFNDAIFSQTNRSTTHPETKKRFKPHLQDYWEIEYERFVQDIRDDSPTLRKAGIEGSDPFALTEELNSVLEGYVYGDWMKCVRDSGRFSEIVNALCGNWKIEGVDRYPSSEKLSDFVRDISKTTGRGDVLIRRGIEVYRNGNHVRGLRLLVNGYLANDPDGQPEGLIEALKRPVEDDELNALKNELLGIAVSSDQVKTWQDLDKALMRMKRQEWSAD